LLPPLFFLLLFDYIFFADAAADAAAAAFRDAIIAIISSPRAPVPLMPPDKKA